MKNSTKRKLRLVCAKSCQSTFLYRFFLLIFSLIDVIFFPHNYKIICLNFVWQTAVIYIVCFIYNIFRFFVKNNIIIELNNAPL